MKVSAGALLAGVLFVSCSGPQRRPEQQHTGWTIRYSHRTGRGLGAGRDVRPDLLVEMVDEAVRITSPDRGIDARAVPSRRQLALCRDGRCQSAAFGENAATIIWGEPIVAEPGLREDEPVSERIDAPETIANVPTQGARFRVRYRTGSGAFVATLESRWMQSDGSGDALREVFVASLRQRGLRRMADLVRETVGLPLAWDLRIAVDGGDAATLGASSALRASSLEDPPARLPTQ